MRRTTRIALCAVAGTGAALGMTGVASAASWSAVQKIPNDSSSATSGNGSTNVVANLAANGKASIVFRARGNRFWVSRRSSNSAKFGKPTEAFPAVRPITNRFDVGMDENTRLSMAMGQSTGTNDALTGIAGAIQTSKGWGKATRLSPNNGLTYGDPTVVSNPKGDVYAAFAGQSQGAAAVYVKRGNTSNGAYDGLSTLKGLLGSTHVSPPNVDMGITNSGTLYVAFELQDGSIASYRRASSGGWTQLPTIAQEVNGNTPDGWDLDVPSSGPAVIAIAQDGDITLQRLAAGGTAWSSPESVAANAYMPGQFDPLNPQLGVNFLGGIGVATNSRGDAAVAWGTNGTGENAQILYNRSMRIAGATSWPATPRTDAQPGYNIEADEYQVSGAHIDIDNNRNTVAAYSASGATQGESNPLQASVWNGLNATGWSGIQDFSRFCTTSQGSSGGIQGPSLSANGSRGVVVAWGCSSSTPASTFQAGLLWTRSYR